MRVPSGGRMRQGFVEGMAEQVDVWIQGSCISGMESAVSPELMVLVMEAHGMYWISILSLSIQRY